MEYEIRVPLSSLKWYANGELVSNPEFSANMEVIRVGINENYNNIQDIQNTILTLALLAKLLLIASINSSLSTLLL